MLLAGGLSIEVDWHPIDRALLLVLFLAPAASTTHDLWVESDPAMRADGASVMVCMGRDHGRE